MTEEESKEIERLVPLYLSYQQVGISESRRFKYLPYLLSDFDNAISKTERNAKMQALISWTRQTVEEHGSEVYSTLSSSKKLLKQSINTKETLLLKNKIGQVRNAIALTNRFCRADRMVHARQAPSDNDGPTVNCKDPPTENLKVSRQLQAERTSARRQKPKRSSESSQTLLQVQEATSTRTRVDDVGGTICAVLPRPAFKAES